MTDHEKPSDDEIRELCSAALEDLRKTEGRINRAKRLLLLLMIIGLGYLLKKVIL